MFEHSTQFKHPKQEAILKTNLKDGNHSMPTCRTIRHADNRCTNVNRRDLASC